MNPLTGLNHTGKLIPQISLKGNLNLSADLDVWHMFLKVHNASWDAWEPLDWMNIQSDLQGNPKWEYTPIIEWKGHIGEWPL